ISRRWRRRPPITSMASSCSPSRCFYAWFTETQQKNLSEGFYDVVAGIINENL
ncbi:unnamed protein product, partial [Musa acuminata var. zebrina]